MVRSTLTYGFISSQKGQLRCYKVVGVFGRCYFFRDSSWKDSFTGINHVSLLLSKPLPQWSNHSETHLRIMRDSIFRCDYWARYISSSQSTLSFWEPEILVVLKRTFHMRTYSRAYSWNLKKIFIFLFPESIFIIKSGWLINLSHYIGVVARMKGTSRPLLVTSPWWRYCFSVVFN